MRFESLFKSFDWKPIAGCPGRCILKMSRNHLSPSDIVGATHLVTVHSTPGARDPVFVARIADGGLISYQRPDGTFVHTLNTPEGLERKLAQLGIATEQTEEFPRNEVQESGGGRPR